MRRIPAADLSFLKGSAFFDTAGNGDAEQGDGQGKECRQQEDALWNILSKDVVMAFSALRQSSPLQKPVAKLLNHSMAGGSGQRGLCRYCREHESHQYEIGGKGGEKAADEA